MVRHEIGILVEQFIGDVAEEVLWSVETIRWFVSVEVIFEAQLKWLHHYLQRQEDQWGGLGILGIRIRGFQLRLLKV
jgi:hypothetical protein